MSATLPGPRLRTVMPGLRITTTLLLLCLFAAPAVAIPIVGLYTTGVDNSGTVLPGGSIDPHYSLSTNFNAGINTAVVSSSIPGAWSGNNATSKWIGHQANLTGDAPDPAGNIYFYRTNFDLTGFNLSTVQINLRTQSDNSGDIYLNNSDTGFNTSGFSTSVNSLPLISITSGFVTGINTLEFRISNAPQGPTNPAGFRVASISGSGDLQSSTGGTNGIPEPATTGLLLTAVAALGAGARRRRTTA